MSRITSFDGHVSPSSPSTSSNPDSRIGSPQRLTSDKFLHRIIADKEQRHNDRVSRQIVTLSRINDSEELEIGIPNRLLWE